MLKTELNLTIDGHIGQLIFWGDGQSDLKIDGQWVMTHYDLQDISRGKISKQFRLFIT